jgi:hypothetical protein
VEVNLLDWDPSKFLEPVTPEQPAGLFRFGEMGFIQSQFEAACASVAAAGPAAQVEWRVLVKDWEQGLTQSKDLNIAIPFVVCQMNLSGWRSFVAGIELVGALVEKFWAGLHPVKQDPRKNRLAAIGAGIGNGADRLRFTDQVMDLPIFDASPPITLRELEAASGKAGIGRPGFRTADELKVKLNGVPVDLQRQIREGSERCRAVLEKIDQKFVGEWGGNFSPNLGQSNLHEFLGLLSRFLDGVAPAAAMPDATGQAAPVQNADAAAQGRSFAGDWKAAARVSSSADVRWFLQKAADWYLVNDRASSVPEFIRIAISMIDRTHAETRASVSDDNYNKVIKPLLEDKPKDGSS